jgi:large conductance mechanosensitive channel
MPPIGLLLGGLDFKDIKIHLKPAVGKTPEVSMNIGTFINTAIDFLIVAFVIFLMIKGINAMKRKEEVEEAPAAAPEPTKEEILLTEIRDLLAKKA